MQYTDYYCKEKQLLHKCMYVFCSLPFKFVFYVLVKVHFASMY